MKTPGDAAMDLPWLPPSAPALAALTAPHSASFGAHVRHDPGCVLLLAQAQAAGADPTSCSGSLALLETALRFLQSPDTSLVDWRRTGPACIAAIARQQARLASELAAHVAGCDPDRAWAGGMLAPLGWLALAATDPAGIEACLDRAANARDAAAWQRDAWGMDHTALARRLCRHWRLPAWLAPLVGHLGLHARIAERLGAEQKLFQVVQLAIALVQDFGRGLALPLGATAIELTANLGLSAPVVEALTDAALQAPAPSLDAEGGWTAPMLTDLLRLALDQRRQQETVSRLQQDVDQLQQALEQQCHEEAERLQGLKLTALGELAAGAGHEINNPLAVISGQAQYLLKQLALAEEQLVEDPSPTLYLDTLKTKLYKSLTTIIGQSQRIHHVLTDLMQFARPSLPRRQPIAVATLLTEAIAALPAGVDNKNVRVTTDEAPADLVIRGDASQWRTVVGNVLRNALEAAPDEGWVRIRCERPLADSVEIMVEDNGPGPAAAMREHLFDPFFSGRSAGRGRGLGLSTAWRLAKQNGGDVRFAGALGDATRFVIVLPVGPAAVEIASSNGNVAVGNGAAGNGNGHGGGHHTGSHGNGHYADAVKRNGSHAVP